MRNYSDEIEEIRHLDPIDNTRLADSWSGSDAKAALFQDLAAQRHSTAASPRPTMRRARPRRALVLAASLALAAVGIVLASGIVERTSSPAFAIRELPNGVIEIENVSDIRDVEGLENELREFGIEAEVVAIPASPSIVGEAFAYVPGEGDPSPLPGLSHGRDGEPNVFTYRIDPAVFEGRVVIELNVKALPSEPYQASQEAFAPGEALGGLQCALGTPVRAADVAARLPELGLTARWFILSGFESDADGGTYHSQQVDEVPDGEVVASQPLDRKTISFEVVPDGTTAPRWHEPSFSDLRCSEEQAARWRT